MLAWIILAWVLFGMSSVFIWDWLLYKYMNEQPNRSPEDRLTMCIIMGPISFVLAALVFVGLTFKGK